MGRHKSHRRGGKRDLTDEEKELWHHVSQSVQPLQKTHRPLNTPTSSREQDNTIQQHHRRAERSWTSGTEKSTGQTAHLKSHKAKSSATRKQLIDFDRKIANKVRKGRIKIDARLDLHGMHQPEARAALRSFILSCLAQQYRVVLVITGKGVARQTDMPWCGGEETERGVLKRMVPHWLQDPELTNAVISYTQAYAQHGGEGAIYVHLRRASKA